MRSLAPLGQLTIPNGTPSSNGLVATREGELGLAQAEVVTIYAPAALTQTCQIEVSATVASPVWRELTNIDGDPVVIAAGGAVNIVGLAARNLRIATASGNEGAERVFTVLAQIAT